MNLCSNDHEEVCYEGLECPCCDIISQKDEAITKLENEVEGLKTEIEELKSQLP